MEMNKKVAYGWVLSFLLLTGGLAWSEEKATSNQPKQPEPTTQTLDRTLNHSRLRAKTTEVNMTTTPGVVQWRYDPRFGWVTNWRQFHRFDDPYIPGVGWPQRIPVYRLHYDYQVLGQLPIYNGPYWWHNPYPYYYYGYPHWTGYGYGYPPPSPVTVIINNNF